MQSSSRSLSFKQGLAGASPATDARWLNANCSQGVTSSARRSAKAEVRGANPRESTISNDEARMSNDESHRSAQIGWLSHCDFVIRPSDFTVPLCLSSYRASFVNSYSSVQIRPGAPSGLWCNSSISPCEGDGPGANPGFLTSHSLSGLSCRLSFNRMPPHESDHALLDGL